MTSPTFGYVAMVMVAVGIAAVFGVLAHFYRSLVNRPAENTGDLEDLVFWDIVVHIETRYFGCHRDENGIWESDSPRNLAYMVVLFSLVPALLGAAGWSSRAAILSTACEVLPSRHVAPLFCPAKPIATVRPDQPTRTPS